MYRSAAGDLDSASLQTDVMRFMAIIAFCLIAILALVRNAEPAPAPHAQGTEATETVETAETRHDQPLPLRAMEPIVPLPEDEPQQLTSREGARGATPRPAYRPAPSPPAMPGRPSAASGGTDGLSLRFASDRDFMRLVAKGDIQVYAFKPHDVLALNQTFRFLESPAPASVYELTPETIPAVVTSALHALRADTSEYAWGIRMPDRLERQIRAFVDKGATGELVINRFAEVQHAVDA